MKKLFYFELLLLTAVSYVFGFVYNWIENSKFTFGEIEKECGLDGLKERFKKDDLKVSDLIKVIITIEKMTEQKVQDIKEEKEE